MRVSYWVMKRRIATPLAFAAGLLAAMVGLALVSLGSAQTSASQRISFVLLTGSTGGTYFPIGQAIAGIISHPAGLARCDAPDVCGPAGLVASVRTSEGAVANLIAVNAGRANAGLAQSDVVAEAVVGKGRFRKDGPQSHIRVVAALFPEEVHLVAAKGSHIARVADLRGKRVALGAPESGTAASARAVLSAFRVGRLKPSDDAPDVAAQELEEGKLDAFFFVGGAPVELLRGLIAGGRAVLVPIDGAGRKRLLAEEPGLQADTIATDTYPGLAAPIDTVSVRAVWIVNDAEPEGLVYAITRALFNPANRGLLLAAHPSARLIRLDGAARDLPAPLHPGALKFYRDVGAPLGTPPGHRS